MRTRPLTEGKGLAREAVWGIPLTTDITVKFVDEV